MKLLTSFLVKPPNDSRRQRSAAAAAEISSFPPVPSRGIDARSLAAAPPSKTSFRQIDLSAKGGIGARNFEGMKTALPGAKLGLQGGVWRGRGAGGMRGRGAGGARGRGRGRGGKRGRRTKGGEDEDSGDIISGYQYTAEEQAYFDGVEMGVATPYTPKFTTMEALEIEMPAVPASGAPLGQIATIREHLKILINEPGANTKKSPLQHEKEYMLDGGTLFLGESDYANALGPGRRIPGGRKSYDQLPDDQKAEMEKSLVAGAYEALKQPALGDTLGFVEAYGLRNPSYLSKQANDLKAKVAALLPVTKAAKPKRSVVR